jgi:RNA polymerase sigma-70 factor, ECF subfamily
MRDGPLVALILIDSTLASGNLGDYFLARSARADLCRRLGKIAENCASYEKALTLARPQPTRRFLLRRLSELMNSAQA